MIVANNLLFGRKYEANYVFPLDFANNPKFAFSYRKISSTYTGPCFKLMRGSDNATLDIGFRSDGFFDISTALAFVGGGDGFLHTHYDQSGNNNNFVKSTFFTSYAKIIESGSIVEFQGRIGARFGDNGLSNPDIYILNPFNFSKHTLISLKGSPIGEANQRNLSCSADASVDFAGGQSASYAASTNSFLSNTAKSINTGNSNQGSPKGGTIIPPTTRLYGYFCDNIKAEFYRENTLIANDLAITTGNVTPFWMHIGGEGVNITHIRLDLGYHFEKIFYDYDLSPTVFSNINNAIMDYYSIT